VRFTKNEFHIFTVETAQGDSIAVLGYLADLKVGDQLEIIGHWEDNPTYGRQLRAESVCRQQRLSLDSLRQYLTSGDIKGIQEATANKICDHFGDETYQILAIATERLSEVPGIGVDRARMIGKSFRERMPEIKQRALLRGVMGYGEKTARNIMAHLDQGGVSGDKQEQILRENPYLAYEVKRIGFKTADEKAQRIGVPEDSPFRIRAGIHYALDEAASEGHTYLPHMELVSNAANLLKIDPQLVQAQLMHMVDSGKVVARGDCRYLPEHDRNEELVAEKLHFMISTNLPLGTNQEITRAIEITQIGLGVSLAKQQRHALEKAGLSKVMVITGGPGTGKTTTARALIAFYRQFGLRVTLLSPTGKAAKRLAEATGQNAATIHRVLYALKRSNGTLSDEVILVDEMSMVDMELMAWLLRSMPVGTRLVMVGDADQLPSVGPGAVLRDVIESGVIPVVRLNEVFRQASTSGIVRGAHRVNGGQVPQASADFVIRKVNDNNVVAKMVVDLAVSTRAQVLTPTRRSSTGVEALNSEIQSRLNPPSPDKPDISIGERYPRTFRVGDPVICGKNNYVKGVFNGELGVVTAIDPSSARLTAEFDDVVATYERKELNELELAYAFSIHRSQGSEFDEVVIPITTQHYVLLARNLVYTAITRAKKKVTIVGNPRALWMAVKREQAFGRYCGLADRLRTLHTSQIERSA
jgi:exodeoxyribonuclease V alpha subunit